MLWLYHDIKRFVLQSTALSILLILMTCQAAKSQYSDTTAGAEKSNSDRGQKADSTDSASHAADFIIPENIVWRSVPDYVADSLKRSRDFEYADDAAYLTKPPTTHGKSFMDYFLEIITSKGARIFFYILLSAVLLFAFYKIIVENKLYLFYSKPVKTQRDKFDETTHNSEDIELQISAGFVSKDYRSAIRYMHLKTLRLLDEKKWIDFHTRKTNQDYALQLKGTKFERGFEYLTNVYEYAWFGGFEINGEQAAIIREKFSHFYAGL